MYTCTYTLICTVHTHTDRQTQNDSHSLSFPYTFRNTHIVMCLVSAGYNPHLRNLWEAQVIMNTGTLTFVFLSVYIIRVI